MEQSDGTGQTRFTSLNLKIHFLSPIINMTLSHEVLKSAVRQCIAEGHSPSKIHEDTFSIIDNQIDSGDVIHVLYNTCYGGFGFSDEFLKYVEDIEDKCNGNTHNEDIEDKCDSKRESYYQYIKSFAESKNITIEEALAAASGQYCQLAVKAVPRHRKYTIHEYDGTEWVEVLREFNY